MRTLSFLGAGRYGSFWLRLTRPEWFAILVPLVIAGVLGVHRLAQPDALNGVLGYAGWGYDDGVHLGVSLRLTNGALPYRDYVFLHPPGLTVVFAPLAVLARLTSGTDALAVGRVLIALIGLANVVLVGLLARRRGPLAMLLGGMALAVWPLAPDALRTLMVEPIVVLLVLTGAMLLFPDQKSATPRQVFWAGALFGIALSLRLLSILPILAALVVVIWLMRQSLKRFVVGLVTSLAITVLPFFSLGAFTVHSAGFRHAIVAAHLKRSNDFRRVANRHGARNQHFSVFHSINGCHRDTADVWTGCGRCLRRATNVNRSTRLVCSEWIGPDSAWGTARARSFLALHVRLGRFSRPPACTHRRPSR